MKAYTDIEQSKKLAEILPLETADMYYHYNTSVVKNYHEDIPNVIQLDNHFAFFNDDIPCWSLAALLGVLPDGTDITKDKADTENEKYMCTVGVKYDIICTFGNNPIDACVAIIEKLHELKML